MARVLMGLFGLALLAVPAQAADYYGYGNAGYAGVPYQSGHHRLPICDEPKVLSKVTGQLAVYDANIIGTGQTIESFDGIRETKVDVGGPGLIPRRYCGATAYLTGGKKTEVVYLIEFQAGLASIHWGVQACLPGRDPYRVYGSWCRSIRP